MFAIYFVSYFATYFALLANIRDLGISQGGVNTWLAHKDVPLLVEITTGGKHDASRFGSLGAGVGRESSLLTTYWPEST